LQSNIIAQLLTAGWSQYSGPANGGAVTVTISIASPGVVSFTSHNLVAGDGVVFSTTGALPGGISAGTRYFVKTVLSGNTFTIASTVGGTVINTSGSQSGTHTMLAAVRMKTAVTPFSTSMIIQLTDNGGTCIQFSIANSTFTLAGTNTGQGPGNLNPGTGATTYRIIADKYQTFIFTPTPTGARQFVSFGTLYLPTFLQGVITECAWMTCNSQSDSDTTNRSQNWRLRFNLDGVNSQTSCFQCIANSMLIDAGTAGAMNIQFMPGSPYILTNLVYPASGAKTAQSGHHWHDASALMLEPLVAWGNAMGTLSNSVGGSAASEELIRGQLWDAVLVNNVFAGDTTTTFDGHNWWALTDNDSSDFCTMFIATT
jgi:hypothetical protein